MECKCCGGSEYVKSGFVRGLQRYKCKKKGCGCCFTDTKARGYGKGIKMNAIRLYLEGLGFRAIGRFLGISNVTVLNWVKEISGGILTKIHEESLRGKRSEIEVMELDEMWHFVKKKKKNYGSGWLLTEIPNKLSTGNSVVVVKKQQKNSGKE